MKKKKGIILFLALGITLTAGGIGAYKAAFKSGKLKRDYETPKVSNEIRLENYAPFSGGNNLYVFEQEPKIKITDNYPRLDGATAAYPVYGAIVQGLYKGLDENTVKEYVQCNTTPTAYERLINKEVDAIFVAEPSEKQLKMAEKSGVELEMTPIGKEAFVFLVNQENPVNNLSVDQIKEIYTKKIQNWKKVGGKSGTIMAFQRPENSGSQTVMENKVMNGLEMAPPLEEEYYELMGGLVAGVADYRNYKNAIGYSFRYYVTGMKKNEGIKLLSINGTEPSKENIKTGKYPYTVNVYIVTRKDTKNKNLDILKNWILSEEGQKIVEKTGYVPVK
jgi:phosphate transport system substrate-binding protein